MRIRDTYLEKAKVLGDSGTETIDLNLSDPITELYLKLAATNGATYNRGSPLAACVSSIEVVDGSDVLFSLSGKETVGLFGGLIKSHPGEYLTESGSDTPIELLPIRFGRFLYDTVYSLNPLAFRNPQLKIAWNLAAINTVGVTGYGTGTLALTIMARCMEDAPTPTGFLMTKEVYKYTSLASGDTRVDLPTDYPWRLLLLQIYEKGIDARLNISNVKLDCNGGKFIPIDESSYDLFNRMMQEFGECVITQCLNGSDATAQDNWMGIGKAGSVIAKAESVITGADYWWQGTVVPRITTHAGVAMNNQNFWDLCHGFGLYSVFPISFGRIDEPGDAFNAPSFDSVRLYLTNGNAGADVRVGVQQYRNY